jgi:predicted esterase
MLREGVRPPIAAVAIAAVVIACPARLAADQRASKPWCGPDVLELSDHVCFFDGAADAAPEGARHTLVIYMHGMLATTPGFQYVQQRALARDARADRFTLLMPTSPLVKDGYFWPTSQAAQKDQEPALLAGIAQARAALVARLGHPFDETFVVGFSSGAYYASSLAVRSGLDVDGYIVLAGGSPWVRPVDASAPRAPVYVGVSAADTQTSGHSRAFASTLAALGWPYRVEERNVGHQVDEILLAHGLAWLHARTLARKAETP